MSPREDREAHQEGRLRLFVAIELPPAWLAAMATLQERMKQVLAADPRTRGLRLRWTRPEGIHLTLKFLGEVDASLLERIKDALAAAATDMPSIQLVLGRTGSFGGRQAPRVLWAGIGEAGSEGDSRLARLAERIEEALEPEGFPRERRAFSPHLTLARFPEEVPAWQRALAASLAAAVALPPTEPFTVAAVSLMRSHLGPGGARYERLASFPAA